MGWIGRSSASRQFGTGPGGDVRLGDFVLPREAQWHFEGDKGDPDVTVRLAVRDGRPQVIDAHFTAKPDGRQLRTSDLTLLSLDALAVQTFARFAERSHYDPETNTTELTPVTDERGFWAAVNDVDAAVKAPRRGVTAAELEQVARVYRDNVTGRPLEAVRVTLGYTSDRTAARRVQQARRAGLLPATTPGRRMPREET